MADDTITIHWNYGGQTKNIHPDELEWHEQNGWTRADRIAAWQYENRRTSRHRPATGSIPTQPAS